MGYNITLGELKIVHDARPGEEVWVRATAQEVRLEEAPADGSPTDHTNERWPSYTGWGEFCDDTGLHDLFYGDNGLMAEHPGCVVLTSEHLAAFEAVDRSKVQIHNIGRLEWLIWWTRWALDNCKVPVLANS